MILALNSEFQPHFPSWSTSSVFLCLSFQTTPQTKTCQIWCQKWRWWRWSANTKTSLTCSAPARRTVRLITHKEAIPADMKQMCEVCLCGSQVLFTSWWNTLPKATSGSTCARGVHRARTTPSTRAKSPMSSWRSKTWCPAPIRWPEAWSTWPHRRWETPIVAMIRPTNHQLHGGQVVNVLTSLLGTQKLECMEPSECHV